MRYLVCGLVCFALSCGPQPEQQTHEVYRVGAWDLVAHVRDYGDSAYRGQRVQVRVPAHSYSTDKNTVLYYTGLPRTSPVIVFHCIGQPPEGDDSPLIVSGTFAGATQDGVRKAERVAFVIRVLDCHATEIE